MKRKLFLAGAMLALGTVVVSGCVVAPAYPARPGYGYEDEGVPTPPPSPRYEVIGVAPYPGWFWISGFWTWRAGRHAWIGGHWEAPRPGYRWEPHRWEPVARGRGWREQQGRWVR